MKIELEHKIKLPRYFGDEVIEFLKNHSTNIEYDAYSINNRLELISCKGIIENNGMWHVHHNYDNSENEMYIIVNGKLKKQWFSTDKEIVLKVLETNIKEWSKILSTELERMKKTA